MQQVHHQSQLSAAGRDAHLKTSCCWTATPPSMVPARTRVKRITTYNNLSCLMVLLRQLPFWSVTEDPSSACELQSQAWRCNVRASPATNGRRNRDHLHSEYEGRCALRDSTAAAAHDFVGTPNFGNIHPVRY